MKLARLSRNQAPRPRTLTPRSASKALRLAWVAAPLAWLWLTAAAAADGDRHVHLSWHKPVGSPCPSGLTLERDVEQALGRPVFGARSGARLIVHGRIEELQAGVYARLEARAPNGALLGSRELTAPRGRCGSLRDALGVVLTLLVEHGDAELERAGASSGVLVGFGAALTVASTPLPRTAAGVGPSLSLEWPRALRLRADAAYWPSVTIATARGVGAKLEALSLALRLCVDVFGSARAGLGLCAGFEGGALIASPLQLEGPDRQVRLLAHAVLELRARAQLGDFAALEAALGPLGSLSRPRFSYVRSDRSEMPVYRPALAGVIFQISLILGGRE